MRFSRHFERFQGIKPFLHYLMPSRFRQSNATYLKARAKFCRSSSSLPTAHVVVPNFRIAKTRRC